MGEPGCFPLMLWTLSEGVPLMFVFHGLEVLAGNFTVVQAIKNVKMPCTRYIIVTYLAEVEVASGRVSCSTTSYAQPASHQFAF